MMKLYGSTTSPYTRKAMIVLAEKKIEYEFVRSAPRSDHDVLRSQNPLSKIPVLVLDDATNLFDSRVITEYLDSVTPNNRLLPPPGRERILIKRWEALADGICDAAVMIVMENRRPEKERSHSENEWQKKKIYNGLATADAWIHNNSWCLGNTFSLGDIALGCALGYLRLRFPEITWHIDYPQLTRLYDALMLRPSFRDTVPTDT